MPAELNGLTALIMQKFVVAIFPAARAKGTVIDPARFTSHRVT